MIVLLGLAAVAVTAGCGPVAPPEPVRLLVRETPIKVDGRQAIVHEIVQEDGMAGLVAERGGFFDVELVNQLPRPTAVHWHGLVDPNADDGVPYVTQPPVAPGASRRYRFLLNQAGTFWMHSHYGLNEQLLESAPLILRDPKAPRESDQDVVVMLQDFSFRRPIEILRDLQGRGAQASPPMKNPPAGMRSMKEEDVRLNPAQAMREMSATMPGMGKQGEGDEGGSPEPVLLVEENAATGQLEEVVAVDRVGPADVTYDAMLANRRTLDDPEVVAVKPGSTVRLRLIDAAAASNFFISTGALQATAVAVDGSPIVPLPGTGFELAVAQRLDLLVRIPPEGGAFPIIAQAEGTQLQAGIILATPGAPIPSLSDRAPQPAGALSNVQETLLKAAQPLKDRPVDRKLEAVLGGSMMPYVWTINGKAYPNRDALFVKEGERVEILIRNDTGMGHPMHLHGHVFQVVEIDGIPVEGAVRDTIFVPGNSSVKIQFDADNPGIWAFHCHILYHLATGMFTVVLYDGFDPKEWKPELTPTELENAG